MLIGCAEASLDHVKHASAARPLGRLFVLVDTGGLDADCATEMVRALLERLTPFCDRCRGDVLTGLELDPERPLKVARELQANGILFLKPIGGTVVRAQGVAKAIYQVALLEPDSRQVIWAARAVHEGGTGVIRERSRLAADKIVTAMVDEGLLAVLPKAQHAEP